MDKKIRITEYVQFAVLVYVKKNVGTNTERLVL